MEILHAQYRLLQDSRSVLLGYCETISPADFQTDLTGFGGRGIRDVLVHVVNVYQFWLETIALEQAAPFDNPESIPTVGELRPLFAKTDQRVENFLTRFQPEWGLPLVCSIPGRNQRVETTPLAILTHVITHEFHHKGQVLSMSRALGYTPPDTDVIRFS
ncbi:MAG: DinB family protein [Sphingobacteriaceae bacterium]|nr:DinB family protein [Cytophagaceae bacterium]